MTEAARSDVPGCEDKGPKQTEVLGSRVTQAWRPHAMWNTPWILLRAIVKLGHFMQRGVHIWV